MDGHGGQQRCSYRHRHSGLLPITLYNWLNVAGSQRPPEQVMLFVMVQNRVTWKTVETT